MVIKNARLGPIVRMRPAESPRVRQLQSDEQPILGTCHLSVLLDESLLQSTQAIACVRRNHKLIRVGPRFVRNGNRFPSPNEFRPALPKTLPAARGKLARLSVRGAVPALHWLNGDAVADLDSIACKRRQKWRGSSLENAGIARNRNPERPHMLQELVYAFQSTKT